MKVASVRVFVDDLDAAEAFYGQVLGLARLWRVDERRAAGFAVDAVQLVVEEIDDARARSGLVGRFAGVCIEVDGLDGVYAGLIGRGVVFDAPPQPHCLGGLMAHFQDPAGNVFTLVEKAKAETS